MKLLLMDSRGTIVNSVSKEYPLYFPHSGWSEQNPEDWYEQPIAGIIVRSAGGIGGTGEGALFGTEAGTKITW